MSPADADRSYCQRIESALDQRMSLAAFDPPELGHAMRYAVLGHGKRIRPRLVYTTGAMLGIAAEQLDAPACAVELIHAYSLIHDDLPAMDDDNLRRGQPTVHIAYGEATAILAGDALQALAFELLAIDPSIGDDSGIRARLMATLAHACGPNGMVGGQALDMASEGQRIDLQQLKRIHDRKTGQLLRACVLLAAAYLPDLSADHYNALETFGNRIGLAFQVRDDILDVTASTEQLGKTQGADLEHAKATYPALLGLDAAIAYAEQVNQQALAALQPFGANAKPLRALARLMVQREY